MIADIRVVSECVNSVDNPKNLPGNFGSLISHVHPAKLQSIAFSAILVTNNQLLSFQKWQKQEATAANFP